MSEVALARLTPTDLASVSPSAVPPYRRDPVPSIVHLGVGAFARAHLGTYADELLAAGHPAAIHGVSLVSDRAERQLSPQGGLYTVNVREPDDRRPPRVVGSLTRVSTGSDAAIGAIAAASTRMVTLTVTEKGYSDDGGGVDTPAMVLARALSCRDRTVAPPLIAPLDNLLSNGQVLRRRVIDAAGTFDAALAEWIEVSVPFADSVVDRIVPATTAEETSSISQELGLVDLAAVVCEEHRSWAIAGYDGALPLEEVGVEVVDDVRPFERRKLWLLNGPHSAFAYAGLLTACDSIADAVRREDVRAFVDDMVDDVLDVVGLPVRLDAPAFAASVGRRFANPALGHRCAQVAADGSTKLPQRVIPVAMARRAVGLPTSRLALVVAIWIAAVCEFDVPGAVMARPDDPVRVRLDGVEPGRRVDVAIDALHIDDRGFAGEVVAAVDDLLDRGPVVLGDVR